MSKYKHYLLVLVLFSFGSQGLANAFQICSETDPDNTRLESNTDLIGTSTDCHQSGDDKNNSPELCHAKHCCPGATFSAMYLSGQSPVNIGKERISFPNQAYIYSGLNDIYHPPKISR